MALWLEVHEGGRVRTYEIAGARLSIGRGADNEVVLEDPRSSRHHCRVEKTPQGVLLEDLESRNGTILKGYAVKKSIIKPDDEFRIGSVRCFLREG
ncbi:MAG: FHA domain-containing protein, partial [Planctomycetota bacterium]